MIYIIEKLFLKTRFVFSIDESICLNPEDFKGYSIYTINSISELKVLDIKIQNFLNQNIKIIQKLPSNVWILYIVTCNKTKEIASFYIAIYGNSKIDKHDNFHIEKDSVLLCNSFTYPKHRKKGLYKYLIKFVHSHLMQNGYKKIFTIVEMSNIASLKANKSVGLKIYYTNYLIKLFSVNIFSIYIKYNSVHIILLGKLFRNISILNRNNY